MRKFANLKPCAHRIALRLPAHMFEGVKNAANKHDVPYQSLLVAGDVEGAVRC